MNFKVAVAAVGWAMCAAGVVSCKKDDGFVEKTCSVQSPCGAGYKCLVGSPSGPPVVDPGDLGTCVYQTCGLTRPCDAKDGPFKCAPEAKQTAECDEKNPKHFCECVGPNSEPVPGNSTNPPSPADPTETPP
jgi:hypothetical protein